MRYIDYAVIGNQFTDQCPAKNIIHLSAKGSSLGSHYVTGSLVHYLANQYGFENISRKNSEVSPLLKTKRTIKNICIILCAHTVNRYSNTGS